MRSQAKRKVTVRNKIIGGERQLICVPLVAQELQDLLGQAKEAVSLNPDLLEWRADSYIALGEIKKACRELRNVVNDIPLIFTLRHIKEGGAREISQDTRVKAIKGVIEEDLTDLVDIEIMNDKRFIAEIKNSIKKNNTKLILSYHNFQYTPSEEFIIAKLKEAETLGADIAKFTAMPNDYGDVLRIISATHTARKDVLEVPIITISMGNIGIISRIVGGYFGSDVTFAAGRVLSAPGQIKIEDLMSIIKIIE